MCDVKVFLTFILGNIKVTLLELQSLFASFNVKNIVLSMRDVNVFLTFTSLNLVLL